MNRGEIGRRLAAVNRWWRDRETWTQSDRDMRRLRENPLPYDPRPLENLAAGGLYVLYGPRRVGKSAVIKRRIKRLLDDGIEPRRIVHFACDELGEGDLQRLVAQGRDTLTSTVAGHRFWFLDEITSVPEWPAAIKWLRDNTAFDEDTVVLTGSSVKDLDEARKQLAGRRGAAVDSDRILYPMGFRAFCACMGSDAPADAPLLPVSDLQGRAGREAIDGMIPWLDELLNLWEVHLLTGGFPRAVGDHLAKGAVSRAFANGLWDVVYGDALKSAGLSAAQTQRLLMRLAMNLTSPTAMTGIAQDIGVGSHHTAAARVDDLIAAYLVWPCHREGDRRAPNFAAQTKLYFIDPLLARLAHLRDPHLPAPEEARLSEQQIGVALLRALQSPAASSREFTEVMYRKTSTKEIDFAGPAIGATGYESKYVDNGWRSEARTLISQYGRGIMATRSALDTTGDVWAVPAPFVAYLINE